MAAYSRRTPCHSPDLSPDAPRDHSWPAPDHVLSVVKVESPEHSPSCFIIENPVHDSCGTRLDSSQARAPPTEVPLRATQAPKKMKGMMGVFRINPFAMHSGIAGSDGKSGNAAVMPGVCWEPGPLDEEPLMFEFQLELLGYTDEDDDEEHPTKEFLGVVDADQVMLGFTTPQTPFHSFAEHNSALHHHHLKISSLHTFSPDFDLHLDPFTPHVTSADGAAEERYTSTPSTMASASSFCPEDHPIVDVSVTGTSTALLPPPPVDHQDSPPFALDASYHHLQPLPLPTHHHHPHHVHVTEPQQQRPPSSASVSSSSSRYGPPPQVRHQWSSTIQQQHGFCVSSRGDSVPGEYDYDASTESLEEQQHERYPESGTATMQQHYTTVQNHESPDGCGSSGSGDSVGVVMDHSAPSSFTTPSSSATAPTITHTQTQGFHHHHHQHANTHPHQHHVHEVVYHQQQQQRDTTNGPQGIELGVNGLGLYTNTTSPEPPPQCHLELDSTRLANTTSTTPPPQQPNAICGPSTRVQVANRIPLVSVDGNGNGINVVDSVEGPECVVVGNTAGGRQRQVVYTHHQRGYEHPQVVHHNHGHHPYLRPLPLPPIQNEHGHYHHHQSLPTATRRECGRPGAGGYYSTATFVEGGLTGESGYENHESVVVNCAGSSSAVYGGGGGGGGQCVDRVQGFK